MTLYYLVLALLLIGAVALDAWLIGRNRKPPCD